MPDARLGELGDGDLLPAIATPPPGPEAKRLATQLAAHEAPGINTLPAGEPEGASLVWRAARGANVVDVDGNRYLDFTSGFGAAAIGHRHPEVVAAVRAQSEELVHGLGDVHANPARVTLAAELCQLLPLADPRIYYAVSGADAVEIALKTAQLHTGRPGVLAFDPSYHGLTLGALSVSARPHFRRPFEGALRPAVERLPFGVALDEVVRTLGASGEIGAVIVEPIVGREGVLVPPAGWLAGLGEVARSAGALLIVDEILTGFGRVGARFAVDLEGVRPDLVVCGKALGGGLPIGVAAGSAEVMAAWREPGEARHTGTFVGHPLACAAGLAVLRVLDRERLSERAASLGVRVGGVLAGWPERFEACREVRGRGLLWGIELTSAERALTLATTLAQRGVLALAGGAEGRVLELMPPLSITEEQLDFGLQATADVLAEL